MTKELKNLIKSINPFRKKEEMIDGYVSKYVSVYGKLTKGKVLMYEVIDLCRDSGLKFRDVSGELTESKDVWFLDGKVLVPFYEENILKLILLKNSENIRHIKFSTPEQMVEEITDLFK